MLLNVMRYFVSILIIFCSALIQSCQRPAAHLPPTEYLLYTNKSQTLALSSLRKHLKEQNYEISRLDFSTGVISTKPRYFNIKGRNASIRGEQIVTLHQESESVKLRLQYQCDYRGTGDRWGNCSAYDLAAIEKIERIENALLPVVSLALHKATKENPKPSYSPRSQVRGHFRRGAGVR